MKCFSSNSTFVFYSCQVTPDFDQELYFEKLGMLPRIDCRQKKEFMAYSQSENIRPGADGPSTVNDKKNL